MLRPRPAIGSLYLVNQTVARQELNPVTISNLEIVIPL